MKSPAFSKESSTSDSSLAFLETASRVYNVIQVVVAISLRKLAKQRTFQVVIRFNFPSGVMQLRIHASSV